MSIEFNKYYIVIIWILYSNISLIQYKKIKINCFNGALKIHICYLYPMVYVILRNLIQTSFINIKSNQEIYTKLIKHSLIKHTLYDF